MHYRTVWLSLTHEVKFKDPAFELAQKIVDILRSFYETINPRFPLALSDMQSIPGFSMADIGVKIAMLKGHGQVELRADRLTSKFSSLTSEKDIAVVRDSLTLCWQALVKALPGAEPQETTIGINKWLKCEGIGAETASFLAGLTRPTHPLSTADLEADEIRYGFYSDISSAPNQWSARVHLDRSLLPDADLFSSFIIVFQRGGKYGTLEEQWQFAEDSAAKIFSQMEFSPEAPPAQGR